MINRNSQRQFVIDQLRATGEISRNFALENFISRLGAIVCDLNNEGWVISGEYRKNPSGKGKNYIYTLVSEKPKSKHQLMDEHYRKTGELLPVESFNQKLI